MPNHVLTGSMADYVSPTTIQMQKSALSLDRAISRTAELANEITAVDAHPTGRSQKADKAIKTARAAVDKVTVAFSAARSPEARLYATSTEARDAVMAELSRCEDAVATQLTVVATEQASQFDKLAAQLEDLRASAESAVAAAEKAMSDLVNASTTADALALKTGVYSKTWHASQSGYSQRPGYRLGQIRECLSDLRSTDGVINGTFPAHSDGLPEWTRENLLNRPNDRWMVDELDRDPGHVAFTTRDLRDVHPV